MLVFHHIPKTAGSTLLDILRRQYAGEKIFEIDALDPRASLERFTALSIEQRNAFAVVMGHLANPFYAAITAPYELMTFVREPVDQFISTYHYIKRAPHNRFHEQVSDITDMSEYLNFRISTGHANMQTKHLLGYVDIDNSGNPMLISDSILRSELQEKVSQVNYLFNTESFDECLLHLHGKMRWRRAAYYRSLNRTRGRPRRETYDTDFVERVLEVNSVDVELYEMSRQWCRLNLADTGRFNLMKFRGLNRLYSLTR